MRQVPKYGIIGGGRAARHFSHYLKLLNIPHLQWSRKNNSESPESYLSVCAVVLLLISDSALEPFLEIHPTLRKKMLVHFSGAIFIEGVAGFHPLMTFGPRLYSLKEYQEMSFVVEEEGVPFYKIFPELDNPYYAIPKELKSRYHALCVMSGNFTTILWQKFFSELETRFKIPRKAGFSYLKQIYQNLVENPGDALTGPLARGDYATITRNINSLEGDPFQNLYRAFVEVHGKGLL